MALSTLTSYVVSLAQRFVFFSSDVQTTTLAIAITGSLCCSIIWFVVNLLTSSSPWTPERKYTQFSSRRDPTPPPCQRVAVPRRKISSSSYIGTSHLSRENTNHSIPVPGGGGGINISSNRLPSKPHLMTLGKRDHNYVEPCMRCGLRAADKLCRLFHCGSCCQTSIADSCDYHGGSPQAAQGLIEGACHYKPTEVDLSYLNLQLCPERVGYIGAQLTTLNLSNNRLTVLPEELGCLMGLQELFLQYNCLSSLPVSIGNLTRLQELDLKNNSLRCLPDCMGNLTQLRYLKLMNNQLSSLPTGIGALSHLEELSANANQLIALPDELCNLSKLTVLYLGDNKLTQLPEQLGCLIRLTELDVAGCELTKVPESLCRCAALIRLWLSNNRLRSLPARVGHLHQLKELHIKNNELTVLPASLACLHLYTFTASHNPLLEESSKICSSLNRSPVHPVPPLSELAASTVISAKVKWRSEQLPEVLQDMLKSVQYCSCCDRPVFQHYYSQLVFAAIGVHKVPLYQRICTSRHSQHCRFINL